MGKSRKGIIILVILILFVVFLFLKVFDRRINTVHYDIENSRIQEDIKIVYISDLHSTDFGENQRKVIEKLEREEPDLVLLGGDIFDDIEPSHKAVELLDQLKGKYKTYFVSGNHEFNTGRVKEIKEMVREKGIHVLEGETLALEIKNTKIDLSGTDDNLVGESRYKEQLKNAAEQRREEAFSILLTHQPKNIDLFREYHYDLILAGHNHGGQVRIPFLVDGLFSREERFFPKYSGGEYDLEGSKLIIGRGLNRKTYKIRQKYPVPRIFNPPELVVIHLKPDK